jgi:hypothetical protein
MALSTFFPCADHIDTPSEENIETLIGILFVIGLITYDETLSLAKNSSIGFKSGE